MPSLTNRSSFRNVVRVIPLTDEIYHLLRSPRATPTHTHTYTYICILFNVYELECCNFANGMLHIYVRIPRTHTHTHTHTYIGTPPHAPPPQSTPIRRNSVASGLMTFHNYCQCIYCTQYNIYMISIHVSRRAVGEMTVVYVSILYYNKRKVKYVREKNRSFTAARRSPRP